MTEFDYNYYDKNNYDKNNYDKNNYDKNNYDKNNYDKNNVDKNNVDKNNLDKNTILFARREIQLVLFQSHRINIICTAAEHITISLLLIITSRLIIIYK